MDNIINFRLLANPVNWVVIFLTLYLIALFSKLLYTAATTGEAPIQLPNF